jgi:hypothetical protein
MKNLMIILFVLISGGFTSMKAQNFWKGGTPGQETAWNVAKNWSENRIPDWTADVIIADVSTSSGYFPVIDNEVEPIAHLEIHSGAILTVLPTGKLTIDGGSTFNSGITLIGNISVDGDLEIKNTALYTIDNLSRNTIEDKKMIAVLKTKEN